MAFEVFLHPIAEKEFWDAVDGYDAQKDGLGKHFAKEVEKAVSSIANTPLRFPIAFQDKRRAAVNKFPYLIIFIARDDKVTVLGIFHTKRHPRNWQNR